MFVFGDLIVAIVVKDHNAAMSAEIILPVSAAFQLFIVN